MDFKVIDEFKNAYWTYYKYIVDRVLKTGKRFPINEEEGILFNEISNKLTSLTENIADQLSKNSETAPVLLGHIQLFLNEIYRADDINSSSEPFCEQGNRIPIHPAIDELQKQITMLCNAYEINCNVYKPKSNEKLSGIPKQYTNEEEKENIAKHLFTSKKSREFVDKALLLFQIVNEDRECIAQKGKIRGFVDAMRDNKYLNVNQGTEEQIIEFQKYINHPDPTRIHPESKVYYDTKDEINAYIDRYQKKE